MSSVTIQNVTKSFGNTVVLEDFDADTSFCLCSIPGFIIS